MDYQNCKVIVTGAATGIGLATAQHLHGLGARVAMLDIQAEQVVLQASQLDEAGERAQGFRLDVGDADSVAAACAEAIAYLGGATVLVNCAATYTPTEKITEVSVQAWQQAIQIDLTGAFLMCRELIPAIKDAGGGAIVNVASQLGSVASAGRASYCTAKGGLIQLTKVLALDHAEDGIRVNSVSPGAVLTDRLTRRFGSAEAASAALGPKHPIGRLGEVGEIARAIAFVISDDASFMTGSDLLVDGGYNAQ